MLMLRFFETMELDDETNVSTKKHYERLKEIIQYKYAIKVLVGEAADEDDEWLIKNAETLQKIVECIYEGRDEKDSETEEKDKKTRDSQKVLEEIKTIIERSRLFTVK